MNCEKEIMPLPTPLSLNKEARAAKQRNSKKTHNSLHTSGQGQQRRTKDSFALVKEKMKKTWHFLELYLSENASNFMVICFLFLGYVSLEHKEGSLSRGITIAWASLWADGRW